MIPTTDRETTLPLLMVAGEASGDQHGAALVQALREHFPHLQVYGLGGAAMRAVGVETLFDIGILNAVGAVEVARKIPLGLWVGYRLLRTAVNSGTRVVVLIDAPMFNLSFAGWATRAGLRVMYYISPQLWAWWPGRVRKVARRVDKMLTLFPFEVPFYTAAGVDAEYVGHPLVDQLAHLPSPQQAAHTLGLDAQRPIVALLPGSRQHEVARLLPPMLQALQRVKQRLPHVQGVLPIASTINPVIIQTLQQRFPVPLRLVQGDSHTVLRAADFAVVASGTATLEAGLIGTPMVIVYRVHPLTAWLARRYIVLPYVGLVNIVAGRCVVPELLQEDVQPDAMAQMALRYLEDTAAAQRMRAALAEISVTMGQGQGAQRAAACIGRFLRQEHPLTE